MVRMLGALWGVAGVALVLVYAATRLSVLALEAIRAGLAIHEWGLLLVSVTGMAWAEGYRGFQQRFAPRVAARAWHLSRQPTWPRVLLAPLFCSGFFAATPRVLRLTWVGAALIVLAVVLVDGLSQPWRGILDAGVVAGLLWGTVALLAATFRTFREGRELVSAEVRSNQGL
jgi:hypothetical protein